MTFPELAIFSKKYWDKFQKEKCSGRTKKYNKQSLLLHKIFCKKCGSKMIYSKQGKYEYYSCPAAQYRQNPINYTKSYISLPDVEKRF